MSKRRCGTCSFYQEAGLAGSGWCHHPQRKTTSDLLIMVRRNELACRDQWARDLWQGSGRNGDADAGVAGGHPVGPVQPATAREIAAVVQAETRAGASLRAEVPGGERTPALEDVVLSETGGGLPSAPAAGAESPAWSWPEEELASAVRESDTRAAIKKAREAYRDRNRRVTRGGFDEPADDMGESGVVGGSRLVATEQEASAENPPGDQAGMVERGSRRPSLSFVEAGVPEAGTNSNLGATVRGPDPEGGGAGDDSAAVEGAGRESAEAAISSGPGVEEHWPSATDGDGRGVVTPQRGRTRGSADARYGGEVVAERATLVAERPLLSTGRTSGGDVDRGDARPWRFDRRARAGSAVVALANDEVDEEAGTPEGAGELEFADQPAAMADAERDEEFPPAEESGGWEREFVGSSAALEDDANGARAEEPIPQIGDRVDAIGEAALAPAWGGRVPRVCRTCRDFRPAEGGERGWCANQWAFSHRRVVAAEDEVPCESSLGSWWLPVDEVWAGGVDVAAHGQPTPLLDAFLPHHRDEPQRRRRS